MSTACGIGGARPPVHPSNYYQPVHHQDAVPNGQGAVSAATIAAISILDDPNGMRTQGVLLLTLTADLQKMAVTEWL